MKLTYQPHLFFYFFLLLGIFTLFIIIKQTRVSILRYQN